MCDERLPIGTQTLTSRFLKVHLINVSYYTYGTIKAYLIETNALMRSGDFRFEFRRTVGVSGHTNLSSSLKVLCSLRCTCTEVLCAHRVVTDDVEKAFALLSSFCESADCNRNGR